MTPRELLGVFVRLAGLGFLLLGFFDLYHIVVKVLGFETQSPIPLSGSVRAFVFYFAWGLVLIVAARPIVKFAFLFEKQS
jgi:hypothetical protein